MGVPTYGAIILDETLENVSMEIVVKDCLEGGMVYAGRSNSLLFTFFFWRNLHSLSDLQRSDSYLMLVAVYRNIICESVNTLLHAFPLRFYFFIWVTRFCKIFHHSCYSTENLMVSFLEANIFFWRTRGWWREDI